MSKITSRDLSDGCAGGFVDTAAQAALGWLHEVD
jgi:hypothetical protein